MAPDPQTAERPGGTGRQIKPSATGHRERDYNAVGADPVERILSRLERVRRCGKGHIARCPAHEDKTASLSITEGEGGTALLHCFAGCRAADVVGAMDLELSDLFVKEPTTNMTFAERSALREHGRQAQWKAALNVIGFESKVMQIAGRELRAGHALNEEDQERLVLACQRVDSAREVLIGR